MQNPAIKVIETYKSRTSKLQRRDHLNKMLTGAAMVGTFAAALVVISKTDNSEYLPDED